MRVYFNPLCVGGGQGRRPLTQIKRLLLLFVWYLRMVLETGVGGCQKEATTCTLVALSFSLSDPPVNGGFPRSCSAGWTPYSSLLPGFMARLRRRSNHSLSSILFARSFINSVSPAVERFARSHASLPLLLEC